MNKNLFGGLCLSIAASIWGGMYVVSKYVLNYVPPLTLLWIRYAIAVIVLFFAKNYFEKNERKRKIEKKDWILLLWIGFIGYFISIAFQFIGTKLSTAHSGALITSAKPAFILIFAKLILNEEINLKKVLSFIFSLLGIIIVVGFDMSGDMRGSVFLVLAALTWALLSVYVKIASKKFSSLTITSYGILFALIFTTPFAIIELKSSSMILDNGFVILGILYLGFVSTAGAFFLWNKGLEMMEASIGSLFFLFQPLVGTFLSWVILKEKIGVNFFIGTMLIFISIFVATYERKPKILLVSETKKI